MIGFILGVIETSLSPKTVRGLQIFGSLWPEFTALGWYLGYLWLPLIHAWSQSHRAWSGVAFLFFVYLTHQQTPLGRSR
jgi:hypothetical protein